MRFYLVIVFGLGSECATTNEPLIERPIAFFCFFKFNFLENLLLHLKITSQKMKIYNQFLIHWDATWNFWTTDFTHKTSTEITNDNIVKHCKSFVSLKIFNSDSSFCEAIIKFSKLHRCEFDFARALNGDQMLSIVHVRKKKCTTSLARKFGEFNGIWFLRFTIGSLPKQRNWLKAPVPWQYNKLILNLYTPITRVHDN